MKILAVIAIILGLITAVGIVAFVWAMAWLAFEDTKTGKAITEKIIERINK